MFLGFPGGLDDKETALNVGDLGLIPVLGRSPRGGNDNPFQYVNCLEFYDFLYFVSAFYVILGFFSLSLAHFLLY